jgi:hypothetical protein
VRLPFLAGAAAAVALMGGLSEAYLRRFPPADLQPYLGDRSPLRGPYAPHPRFVATYRSWEAFQEHAASLSRPLRPLADPAGRPTWAFFGNSFAEAPGMLADAARVGVPSRYIFNLGFNSYLFQRFAEIELLLDHGLKPTRLVLTFLPIDALALVQQPLATVRVARHGALTYDPLLPTGPLGCLARHSLLAQSAWLRGEFQRTYRGRTNLDMALAPPPGVLADLRRLFEGLTSVAAARRLPVTVVVIPNQQQILGDHPLGFQAAVGPMLRELGFDVCDVAEAFSAAPDKPALFIPDGHFSVAGNVLLLNELLRHLGGPGAPREAPP